MSSTGRARFRLASPATALVLGCLVLALFAAAFPLDQALRLSGAPRPLVNETPA
jgi:hypothetical protein